MTATAYTVEAVVFGTFVFGHLLACLVMAARLKRGLRPTRISKSACYLGFVCTGIEMIRAVDPTAAFEIYEGRYLPLMSQSISICIMISIAHVTYEVINVIFIEATNKQGKKHRSKGLAKIKRTVKFVAYTCIFVGLLTAVLVAADNRELYIGIWSIWMGVCLVIIVVQLSVGGRWLRRRLRRYFKKQYPNDKGKVRNAVRHHVERLTYFRYSLVGLMVAVIVVMLITGIAEIVSDEEVDGADPDDYDFFAFYPIWIQTSIVTVMLWFGWVPVTAAASAPKPSMWDTEQPKADSDLKLEERAAAFGASPSAQSAGAESLQKSSSEAEVLPPKRMDTEKALRMEQMKRYAATPPALPPTDDAPPVPMTQEEKDDEERERILLAKIRRKKAKQQTEAAAAKAEHEAAAEAEDSDSEDDATVAREVAEDEDDDEVHEDSEEEAPAQPTQPEE